MDILRLFTMLECIGGLVVKEGIHKLPKFGRRQGRINHVELE